MQPTIRLVLPRPISLNNAYANVPGRGRVKTKDYAAWQMQAAQMLSAQQTPLCADPVEIFYHVGERGVGNMDAGNCEKAYTDALVTAGVLVDDNRTRVRAISVQWCPDFCGCIAIILPAVEPLPIERLIEGVRGAALLVAS